MAVSEVSASLIAGDQVGPESTSGPSRRVRREVCGTQLWRRTWPALKGEHVTLREVRQSDAAPLLEIFADPEVRRYLPPGPRTVDEFRKFITWGRRERLRGRYVCLTALDDASRVIGLFQLHSLECFGTAEWGYAMARDRWGTGLFTESARLLLDYAFSSLEIRRLECRAPVANTHARRAVKRLGGVEEGILRECFACTAEPEDYVIASVLARDWELAGGA